MIKSTKSFLAQYILHPSQWGWKFYIGAIALLLSLNLFGSRGIIHGLIVTQETQRIEKAITSAQNELLHLEKQIDDFKNSDVEKLRAIREELGFLRPNEISIEFIDNSEPQNTTSHSP
jgi:hypothetical protein